MVSVGSPNFEFKLPAALCRILSVRPCHWPNGLGPTARMLPEHSTRDHSLHRPSQQYRSEYKSPFSLQADQHFSADLFLPLTHHASHTERSLKAQQRQVSQLFNYVKNHSTYVALIIGHAGSSLGTKFTMLRSSLQYVLAF